MSLPTFTSATTAEEVATVFADQIRGKNVLITGTSVNGIGFETARVIAKYANLVIITGYNAARLELTEEAIKKEVPSANLRPLILDLSHLAAVRTAAAEINAYAEPLHVVIHNAAAGLGPYKLTEDNLELQMATDHIGPFLLTKLLAPKLLAGAAGGYTPRVIFVSSIAHAAAPFVDLRTFGRPAEDTYNMLGAYAWAKQANILTALELSRRSEGRIHAFSLHPGAVFTNMVQKEESKGFYQQVGLLTADGKPGPAMEWITIPQGAATTVVASFDPRLGEKPGAYLKDCIVANDQLGSMINEENAVKVWKATEEVIGEKFEL